jgi:hypothetical protein
MLLSTGYGFKYYSYDDAKNKIVDSITKGFPFILNTVYDLNGSNVFYNSLLVYGIIRDENDEIVGVTCHDFAGDANSNYVNKNGSQVVYSGNLFKNMIGQNKSVTKTLSVVGVPIEEAK